VLGTGPARGGVKGRGSPRPRVLGSARQGGGGAVPFALHVRNDNRERTPRLVRLKAVCGPGDQDEPVITVMLPGKD
jgi:hypothetical protein